MSKLSKNLAAAGWRLLGCLALVGGCGDEDEQPANQDAGDVSDADGGAGDDASGADAGGDGAAARVSKGCDRAAASSGDSDAMLSFGGASRAYRLHVPQGYSGQPTPLVINLHGFLSNYEEQADLTHMSTLADSEDFIVAYPNGGGTPPAWNAGDCCEFKEVDRDDVSLVGKLLDEIEAEACVDLTRVYVTGFSNGGFLAHRVGCELSERVAAIASVAGVLGIPPESCKPGRALPVLQIHGDADPTVPYAGGSPMGWEILYPGQPAPTFRSATATADFWRENNGCTSEHEQGFHAGDADCQSFKGCSDDSEVTLCTIAGGGHAWPGGDPSAFKGVVSGIPIAAALGKTSTDLDSSAQIWSFFKKHPLP